MKFSDKKRMVLKEIYQKGIDSHCDLYSFPDDIFSNKEIKEIAKVLENEGLIKFFEMPPRGRWVSITGEGMEYVEKDIGENFKMDSGFSNKEIVEMNQKLDQILNRLDEMGLGQELTYNDLHAEMEELKELLHKLSKKNWKEVFLGKMIEMGLGRITEEGWNLISSIDEEQNLLR